MATAAVLDAGETPSKLPKVADSNFKLFYGKGSQKKAFAYGQERGWSDFVAHGPKDSKVVTDRGVFESRAAFKQYLREHPEEAEQWCHLIKEGQQDRLRADLDIHDKAWTSLDDCKIKGKALLDRLVAAVEAQCFPGGGAAPRLHISDRTRTLPEGPKYSAHIIADAYFDTTAHQKQFWTEFGQMHPELGEMLDMSVYSKNSVWNETKRTPISEGSKFEDFDPTYVDPDRHKHISVQLATTPTKRARQAPGAIVGAATALPSTDEAAPPFVQECVRELEPLVGCPLKVKRVPDKPGLFSLDPDRKTTGAKSCLVHGNASEPHVHNSNNIYFLVSEPREECHQMCFKANAVAGTNPNGRRRRSVLVHLRDDANPLAEYKRSLNHHHQQQSSGDAEAPSSPWSEDDATSAPAAVESCAPAGGPISLDTLDALDALDALQAPPAAVHLSDTQIPVNVPGVMGCAVYLHCIAPARADAYDTWTAAGSILKRSGLHHDQEEEAFAAWHRWSRTTTSALYVNEAHCRQVWDGLPADLPADTLHDWVFDDNQPAIQSSAERALPGTWIIPSGRSSCMMLSDGSARVYLRGLQVELRRDDGQQHDVAVIIHVLVPAAPPKVVDFDALAAVDRAPDEAAVADGHQRVLDAWERVKPPPRSITDHFVGMQPLVYSEEYVRPFPPKFGTLCLRAPMGSGKTMQLFRWLQANASDKSILILSMRQSLATDFMRKPQAKAMRFTSYLAVRNKDQLHEERRLVLQVESLKHLPPGVGYDVVVLDELESLLHHFTSRTLDGTRRPVFELLQALIKNAAHVVAMDADLALRGMHFLRSLRPTAVLHVNTLSKRLRVVYTVPDYDTLVAILRSALRQGRRFVVATNGNVASETARDVTDCILRLKTAGTRVLLVNKESEKPHKLGDPNELWPTYDVVIYSPTIGPGVDFAVPDHFDFLVTVGQHHGGTARELSQQKNRVRCFRLGLEFSYIKPRSKRTPDDLPTDPEDIRQLLQSKVDAFRDQGSDILGWAMDGTAWQLNTGDRYTTLFLHNVAEVNESANDFAGTMHLNMRRQGHTVLPFTAEASRLEDITVSLAALAVSVDKGHNSRATAVAIVSAAQADSSEVREAEQATKDNDPTPRQALVLEAHLNKLEYGCSRLDVPFVEAHGGTEARDRFRSFSRAVSSTNADLVTRDAQRLNTDYIASLDMDSQRAAWIRDLLERMGFASLLDHGRVPRALSDDLRDILTHRAGDIRHLFGANLKIDYTEWTHPRARTFISGLLDGYCGLTIQTERTERAAAVVVADSGKKRRQYDHYWRIGPRERVESYLELMYAKGVSDLQLPMDNVHFRWAHLTGHASPHGLQAEAKPLAVAKPPPQALNKLRDLHAELFGQHPGPPPQ